MLLLALLIGGVYSFISLSTANTWLRHTDEVRVGIAQLRSTVLDAETGLRGYLITGERDFLAPYDRARDLWRGEVEHVRALTTDNLEQQTRLETLEQLIVDDLGAFSPELALRERDQAARAPVPLMLNHKLKMDGVRSVLADMECHEVRIDRIREQAATQHWGLTTAFLIAGTLLFVVVVAQLATQRRISEARRRRSEDEQRLLQAVFAGIDDGITLQDRTGKLIFANAAAARMIGFASPAALLAASPREIMDRFELLDEEGHPYPADKLPARAVLTGARRRRRSSATARARRARGAGRR